jgi:hypothetical protein
MLAVERTPQRMILVMGTGYRLQSTGYKEQGTGCRERRLRGCRVPAVAEFISSLENVTVAVTI